MGWFDKAVKSVRTLFDKDKERLPAKLAKGATSDRLPVQQRDLLYGGGGEGYGQPLVLDQDLAGRYADYEEMDEYPLIACLAGPSLVFTLEEGWIAIEALVGRDFHVLSYDAGCRSLVPSSATAAVSAPEGHSKPMVRVILDNGSAIVCTEDHPFLLKDGHWSLAGDLAPGGRLMPGHIRITLLSGTASLPYWQVHQPRADAEIRSVDGKRWVWLHRLVAEMALGAGKGDIVHHKDGNSLNNAPSNLSVETASSHASCHIARIDNTRYLPEWTPGRRAQMAERMRGNTFAKGKTLSAETRARMSASAKGRRKSAEWRRKIGESQPNRINISREALEAALRAGGTVAEAARLLGVSWSKAKRAAQQHDLVADGNNHRVLRVERLQERPAVYDLQVPGYHNFVCGGVVVHNTALDIFADDATQIDSQRNRTIWITSQDKKTVEILDEGLLRKNLRLDEEIWEIARTLCLYGNDFEELLVTDQGVVGLNFLPPPTIRRMEDADGILLGYLQSFRQEFGLGPAQFKALLARRLAGKSSPDDPSRNPNDPAHGLTALEDWEVVHFRLRAKRRRGVYGISTVEAARWIWKRLTLLEDAAVLFRLTKAIERYAFYVDTGDMPPAEAMAHLNKVRQRYRKKRYTNPSTGKLELRTDALLPEEDFFVPSRNGQDGTRIDVLGAPQWQCLAGETRIPLLDGTRPTIADLAERGGSFDIWSCDQEGLICCGRGHSARVSHPSAPIWEVTLHGGVVRCTGNHPFLTAGCSWVLASDLLPGQALASRGAAQRVLEVRETGASAPVYDLTVDGTHCFLIGQGVFVHNSVEDLEYFRDYMFAAIKVPKSYLAQEEGVARAVLSSEDVRFARTVLRVQRELKSGVGKICRVHLMALGIDPSTLQWEIWMTVPSAIFELAQLEVRNARADLAGRMNDFVSLRWILQEVFGLRPEEIEVVFKERSADVVRASVAAGKGEAEAQKLVQAAAPQESAGDQAVAARLAEMHTRVRVAAEAQGHSGRITRRELDAGTAGSREKLDAILKQDRVFASRLREITKLLREVAAARMPKGS